MDENTTVQTEAEELADETSAAFDAGWDDSDEPEIPDDGLDAEVDESDEPETDSESEEAEADADQQEAEDDEGGEADTDSEGEESGDEGQPDQGESFTLKHLGEEKAVSRDEVVQLAQKGMDYDRIREKWDGVKDNLPMYQMEHAFLQELAESRGGDILGLIDETRTRTILARAEARGEEISPAEAATQAVKLRMDYSAGAQDAEAAQQERSQREIDRFLKEYPNVRAEDIPPELWEKVKENDGDLVGTYRMYENQKLKEEIKNLKKELAGNTQQKKNKARSTGSTKSVGTSAGRDAFDEGWDSDY